MAGNVSQRQSGTRTAGTSHVMRSGYDLFVRTANYYASGST